MQDDQGARREVVTGFRNVHFCVVSKESVWPTNKAAKVVSLVVRRFDRALVVDDDDLLSLWFQNEISWPNVSTHNPFSCKYCRPSLRPSTILREISPGWRKLTGTPAGTMPKPLIFPSGSHQRTYK